MSCLQTIKKHAQGISWKIPFSFMFVALAIILIVYFIRSYGRSFDEDEFEAIHTAWKILHGEHIYVDFFQHHNPLFYYLLTIPLYLFGESVKTITAIRVIQFCFYLLTFQAQYYVATSVFTRKTSVLLSLAFLAASNLFFDRSANIRPDTLQVLFCLYAFGTFLRSRTSQELKYSFLTGFFLGISFLFLQKAVYFCAIILFLQIVDTLSPRNNFLYPKYRRITTCWLAFLLALSPYVAYLVCNGWLETYIFLNFKLNSAWMLPARFSSHNIAMHKIFIKEIVTSNPVFGIFFFGSLFFIFDRKIRMYFFISLYLVLTTALLSSPFRQSYLLAVPFMSITAALVCSKILESSLFLNTDIAILLVLILTFYYPLKNINNYRGLDGDCSNQMKLVTYVLDHTEPTDFVYDGQKRFNLFRKDIDYFWFSIEPEKGGLTAYKKLKYYHYNIYEKITSLKPKIISDSFINNLHDSSIADFYKKIDMFPGIYIRQDKN